MLIPTNRLRDIKANIIWQPICAIFFITLVLFALDMVNSTQLSWAVGASSFASSAYIVFAIPKSIGAQPRRIVGGYVVAILVGLCMHFILTQVFNLVSDHGYLGEHSRIFWISASISVGIAMVVMILKNYQHPPAAGIALVLVIDLKNYGLIGVIMLAAVSLAIVRVLLRHQLRNLVEQS